MRRCAKGLHAEGLPGVRCDVRVWSVFLFFAIALIAATPEQLYKQARRAEKKGDILRAYTLYTQASFLEPKNPEYEGRSMALRSTALNQANITLAPMTGVADLPPDTSSTNISEEDLALMKRLLPPPEVHGSPERHDFALSGTARQLMEQVTKAYGLDVVFDGDYDT